MRTKDYDIDDLGYTGRTNYINYYGYYGYRYLKPRGILNTMFLNFNLNYNRRLEPSLYNNFNFNFNSSFTTKSFIHLVEVLSHLFLRPMIFMNLEHLDDMLKYLLFIQGGFGLQQIIGRSLP